MTHTNVTLSLIQSSSQVARQRKLDIAESKFLGGDMAHTHMVKGLDYALLQKVVSALSNCVHMLLYSLRFAVKYSLKTERKRR